MIFIGDKKEIVMLMRRKRSKWYRLVCIGRKRHYRKDGSCKHTELFLEHMKPDIRNRTRVDGWGGKNAPPQDQP